MTREMLVSRRRLILGASVMSLTLPEVGYAVAAAPSTWPVDVTQGGLAARFYPANHAGCRPSVLMLSGSSGGYPVGRDASDLADRGFPTMALAYFQDRSGSPKTLPSELVRIPIEYIFQAIDWMKTQKGVDPQRIVLMGESRGAELALLVATHRLDIAGVIGFSPTSRVWAGLSKVEAEGISSPAWTKERQPIPYQVPVRGRGLTLYQRFDRATPIENAIIPVERINGPVLLFSSLTDGLWPASRYADEIIARLQSSGFRHVFRHVSFADASHLLMGRGSAPTDIRGKTGEVVFTFGGSPGGTLQARSAAWALTSKFLNDLMRRLTFS